MSLRRFWMMLPTLFILTACETTPHSPRYLPYTIGASEPIYLNVARIEFIDQFKPSFVPPHVEHTFPIKPYDAMHKLVEDRIQVTPMSTSMLKVTIIDAGVEEESLQTKHGVEGMLTDDQSERYKGRMEALFEIYETGFLLPRAKFNVRLDRSGTINERATYKERQDFFYDFTKGMVTQLNTQMEESIRRYFVDYMGSSSPAVQSAPNPWPDNNVAR